MKQSHSHKMTNQDLWVLDLFRGRFGESGYTCLELGAYDGVTNSNTVLLEDYGWQCTLIEAVPEFFKKMKANRPDAKCINACIGQTVGTRTQMFYVNGEWSGLVRTMQEGCRAGHRLRSSPSLDARVVPLSEVVTERHFNYMSLDTEGNEYDILVDWFRSGGSMDALTVEFNYDADRYYQFLHLCEANGMHLDKVKGWDMFFLRSDQ